MKSGHRQHDLNYYCKQTLYLLRVGITDQPDACLKLLVECSGHVFVGVGDRRASPILLLLRSG